MRKFTLAAVLGMLMSLVIVAGCSSEPAGSNHESGHGHSHD